MKKTCNKSIDKDVATNPQEAPKPSSSEEKLSDNFAIGSRLEACASDNWYAARVENINWEEEQVYIHFDGWSPKYNEWIPMKSDRLRSVQKPAPKKPPEKFEIGETVFALWSAYHKSEATVQRQLADGKYEVLFSDGYIKRVLPSKMWHRDDSDPNQKSRVPDIGSKQDRRNRKRKHVVADLFRSNKKPRSSNSQSDLGEKKPVQAPLLASTEEATPSTSTAPIPVAPPTVVSKVKQPLVAPQPFEVTYLDGHKEAWSKFTTRRTEGKTAGKVEIIITSPTGRKFRSRSEIVRFCEENKIEYDPKIFDFSAKGRSKPRPKSATDGPEKLSTIVNPPVIEAQVPVAAPPVVETEIQEEKRFIGELEVVVQDGQFICPVADCRKHFRKENLLHMHTKHYHPDLSKFLDYTPSVTDLAYARTVSILEQDNIPCLKSAVRSELRSAEVKKSPSRIVDTKSEIKHEVDQIGTESADCSSFTTSILCNDPTQVQNLGRDATSVADGEMAVQALGESGPEAASVLPRLSKPQWKRRPYHKSQLSATNWYNGRLGKHATARANEDATGKPGSELVGTIVQRNPILNTLLSSRPLAPVMPWRSNWRRKRRRGWRRRLLPVAPPPAPKTEPDPFLNDLQYKTEDGVDGSVPSDVKYDKLKGNEIINCTCLIKEEDGLMIQCDVCLCWQHGHCQGINPQADVPESYICSICKDPLRGRSSRKYYNHQDWMKQGILPTLPSQPKQPSQRRLLLKRAFEVSGQLSLISRLLHSLRVKLSIASNKDHPKLWLWAKKWQEEETSSSAQPVVKEEEPITPKAPQPEKPIDPIECKLNLLDHILHYQDLVQNRLNSLEDVVTELEAMDGVGDDKPENLSRISATMKMLLRDLDTVKKLSALP